MDQEYTSPRKILCFGELLLRMSPRVNGGWIHDNNIATYIGGAELNVATALAKWGLPSKYFTALPDHSLSHDLIRYLQEKKIDASSIRFSGNRVGIYFLPQGSDLKNAGVIYDRAHSSFSELKPGEIDWEEALRDVSWLHLSAISPALSQDIAEVCAELLKTAFGKGITISIDLNYRSKLWKYGKHPSEIMPGLVQYCDVIMGNIWAAEDLLGISVNQKILKDRNKASCIEHAEYTSQSIRKAFPKAARIANTFRFDRPENAINYFATLYTGNDLYISKEINAFDIKDKIGSGDCFMAGLLYGIHHHWDPDHILNFSAAAAVGKMYEASDATNQEAGRILLNATNTWIQYG